MTLSVMSGRLFQHFAGGSAMNHVISIAEKVSRKTADMIGWREQLMWSYPITSNQITAADLWLARRPHLPLHTACEILYRTVKTQALLYEHSHPADKHEYLLSIRGGIGSTCWRMKRSEAMAEPKPSAAQALYPNLARSTPNEVAQSNRPSLGNALWPSLTPQPPPGWHREDIALVQWNIRQGRSDSEIAKTYGVSKQAVSEIRKLGRR
jgi:hypothetical protein